MNSLQAIELMEVDELQDAEQQFEITCTNELNWTFRKLEALNAKENEIKESANFERNRVNQWEQKELKPINDSRSYFEGLVFGTIHKCLQPIQIRKQLVHHMENQKVVQVMQLRNKKIKPKCFNMLSKMKWMIALRQKSNGLISRRN